MTQPDLSTATPEAPSARSRVAGMMRKAVLWNTLNFIFAHGASIVIFLIIASRVPPHVFGVIALAALAADFVSMDGRYAAKDALLQARRFDDPYLNAAFTSFVGLAVVITIILVILTPYASAAYDEPLVATFMPLFGLMLLPVPWLAVMDALMLRDLRYKEVMQRNVAATLISGAIGIGLAFSPYLIWALFAQRLTSMLVQNVLLYHFTRWFPRLSFQWRVAIDFLRRFLALWAINTLVVFIGRITLLVFGFRYDITTVGLLRAANRITEAVQGPVVTPLMGLWFPLMSRVKGDLAAEREVYDSILRTASLISLPAFAGLAIVAPDLVSLALPPQYEGVTPILQATSLTMLLVPVLWFNNAAMTAMRMNKVSLAYTLVLVVSSVVALLLSQDASAAETILIMAIPAGIVGIAGNIILNRRLDQTNTTHYSGLLPAVLATIAMSAATIGASNLMGDWQALPRLLASAGVGISVYGAWLMTFHREWFMNCVHLLIDRRAQPV